MEEIAHALGISHGSVSTILHDPFRYAQANSPLGPQMTTKA